MPNFEAKVSAPQKTQDISEKPGPKRSALEEVLNKALEGGQNIGAFARKEFSEIMDRIPPLPLNKAEFENLQKSDPEVAGILELEQGKIMNEIGTTLDEIRLAERKDPHCVHYEVLQRLYSRLKRLEESLPLSDIGIFNSKVLNTAPIPDIELSKLEAIESLKKTLTKFTQDHFATLEKALPDILVEKIGDFIQGFSTGIIKAGADIVALVKTLHDNPEEFIRSLKLLAKYMYDQGPWEVLKKMHGAAVDATVELIDSTEGSDGGNIAFDTGYAMSHCLSLFTSALPAKITLFTLQNAPKLTPQLTDPVALLKERKNYLFLVGKVTRSYPQIQSLTAQKIVDGLTKVLSSYAKPEQVNLINNLLERALYSNSESLFNEKGTLKLFVDTAYTLPDKERRDVVITMMSIHKPSIVKTVEPLLVTLTKDQVYQYLGIA